jgi:hypothetical protein
MKRILLSAFICACFQQAIFARPGGDEINGQFEPALVPNVEDLDKVILKGHHLDSVNGLSFSADAHVAASMITDPRTGKASLPTCKGTNRVG